MRRTPGLRERALRLLARREHGRAELAAKLRPHTGPRDDLDALLEDLARRKLLSDDRYAESRAQVLSRRFGASRIAYDLKARGLDKDLVERVSRSARETEVVRAREVWHRKFRIAARSRQEQARQIRFLQSRGFSFDAIRAVVGGQEDG